MLWLGRNSNVKIRTLQKQSKISYDHLTDYAAVAYGPLLNVMMEAEGSADAVLKSCIVQARHED